MTASKPTRNFGRHLFGAAALAFGIVALTWHDYKNWDQLRYVLNATDGPIFLSAVAGAQLLGGAAIQFVRTEKIGAGILGAVYLVFAFLAVPPIVAKPETYVRWGDFFEQLSLVSGAFIVFWRASARWDTATLTRFGRILFGVCSASFGLEQAIYLDATASLVPKWLPPSQQFWAVATTVAFAVAAVALLTDRLALLATRLLTLMIVTFGLLVWVPQLLSHRHGYANWSEEAETFAIAGALWILADLLGAYRLHSTAARS